jgi:outer membrane lipoprotein-sorting protein
MRCWPLVLVFLFSCPKPNGTDVAPSLLGQMKQKIAERDRKLNSFHIAVESIQGVEAAKHEFYFKSPNHSRGVLLVPQELTLSFDGHSFYRLLNGPKQFEKSEFKLPPDQVAVFLASTFQPFVPEGFRAPLIPQKNVTAKKISHALESQAVEIEAKLKDESGNDVSVIWVLRESTGDFLERRSDNNVLTVKAEFCDKKLNLCVPKKLEQQSNGTLIGSTHVTHIELNPVLTFESFALKAPEGFAVSQTEMQKLP